MRQARGREKFVHGLGGKTDRLEDLGVEERIILKSIFKKNMGGRTVGLSISG